MTIVIDGAGLSVEKLTQIARLGEQVELHPEALETDQSLQEDGGGKGCCT